MIDERARLRADLEAGQWQCLLDPLLPLALLDDPGPWWSRARSACAGRILTLLHGSPAACEARWEWVCTRMTAGRPDAWASPRGQRIVIGWAADRARMRQALPDAPPHPPMPDVLAALEVLRQWPVR